MTLELRKADRDQAVASIQRYFEEHLDTQLGNVGAGGLLAFFLAEIGPCLYNQGVRDAQERLQMRVQELDYEVHADEFVYWRRTGRAGPKSGR